MTFFGLSRLLTPAVALAALSIPASAGIVSNGDFAISFSGTITYQLPNPSVLLDAVSIQLPDTMTVSSLQDQYLGNANDFCTSGIDLCTHSGPTPLTLGGALIFTSNWADDVNSNVRRIDLSGAHLPTLTFTSTNGDVLTFATNGIIVTRSTTGGSTGVDVYYTGLLSDSLSVYTAGQVASLSLSFTQTGGPSGPVGAGGTFATPPAAPPTGTPEPTTMALFGSALVGLGFFGRKRFNR